MIGETAYRSKACTIFVLINNILMTAMCETDVLTTLAKGTDAGLYRLIPRRVVTAADEQTVRTLLAEAAATGQSLTFRAAGTSLSGQAATDSILVETGAGFGEARIEAKGLYATFPCHFTGAEANRLLKPYGRRLGPQPASIGAARIGGIVANNASGAGQGVLHNSYHTIRSLRVILADGTLLDTGSEASRRIFFETHTSLLEKLMNLRMEVLCDPEMTDCILHKYELKNTCGYGVNALLDFEDPYDILVHLMVGSEGTLGFISQATFETVPDPACQAAAWVYFPDLPAACRAILPLRACGVASVEWMDAQALGAVCGVPGRAGSLPEGAVALLIELATSDETLLQQKMQAVEKYISALPALYPLFFTTDPAECAGYRQMRDNLFFSAAAGRPAGTLPVMEDVAFREEVLAEAVAAIRGLLDEEGYADAVIWGHLLDGIVHFTLFPASDRPGEEDRYAGWMRRLREVVERYDGSLKAEQGTGRCLAPFVEKEWGPKIYALMREIKQLFDPLNMLNPGVMLDNDPEGLVRPLKQMPFTGREIDRCIECGFCELSGSSGRLRLTPRQRIAAYRTLVSMQTAGQTGLPCYRALEKAFRHAAEIDCAVGRVEAGLCPLGIDTGALARELQWEPLAVPGGKLSVWAAGYFPKVRAVLSSFFSALGGMPRRVASR